MIKCLGSKKCIIRVYCGGVGGKYELQSIMRAVLSKMKEKFKEYYNVEKIGIYFYACYDISTMVLYAYDNIFKEDEDFEDTINKILEQLTTIKVRTGKDEEIEYLVDYIVEYDKNNYSIVNTEEDAKRKSVYYTNKNKDNKGE